MKKLLAVVLMVLLHCGSAVSGVDGVPLLFCSGLFDNSDSPARRSGTCYNPEWLKIVINKEIPRDQLPKNITVRNYNAVLTVRTDPAADTLRYTIKGLPEEAVTVQHSAGTLSVIEREIRPRNRQTGNDWDRIIADIELIIPSSIALQTVSIQSVIGDAELASLSCKTLSLESSISRLKADDMHCKTLNITGGVSPLKLKKISCSTCDIRTSTAATFIENFIATDKAVFQTSTGSMRIINGQLKNPSLSLTGGFEFTGLIEGDIRLNGGIGTIDMDLQRSEKIRQFAIDCSTGNLRLKNFSADALTLTLSTGNTRIENAAVISSAAISSSTGSLDCENCSINNGRITLSTGSFDFSGILTGDTRIRRSTGSIDLNIQAPEDSYQVYTDSSASSSGNIVINGKSNLIAGNKNAKNTLHIQRGTGRCSIRFLE